MTKPAATAENQKPALTEHEKAQLRTWVSATPAQRLAWLEDALQLAWKAGAIPRREEN